MQLKKPLQTGFYISLKGLNCFCGFTWCESSADLPSFLYRCPVSEILRYCYYNTLLVDIAIRYWYPLLLHCTHKGCRFLHLPVPLRRHRTDICQSNSLTMYCFCCITPNQIHQFINTLSNTFGWLITVFRFLSLFYLASFFINVFVFWDVLYRTVIVISAQNWTSRVFPAVLNFTSVFSWSLIDSEFTFLTVSYTHLTLPTTERV